MITTHKFSPEYTRHLIAAGWHYGMNADHPHTRTLLDLDSPSPLRRAYARGIVAGMFHRPGRAIA